MWVDEDVVDPHLVAAYFKKEGKARLAAAADRRRKRAQDRADRARQHADEMAAIADIWSEFTEEEWPQILSEWSTVEDLGASQCNTHKETEAHVQQCARSAGLLCACLSTGIVTCVREVFGCASLSQRYLFVSMLADLYPELLAIEHDDACHLHKFCAARPGGSEAATRLAPPRKRYICDIFHMTGHTDAWCKVHCSPHAPDLKEP